MAPRKSVAKPTPPKKKAVVNVHPGNAALGASANKKKSGAGEIYKGPKHMREESGDEYTPSGTSKKPPVKKLKTGNGTPVAKSKAVEPSKKGAQDDQSEESSEEEIPDSSVKPANETSNRNGKPDLANRVALPNAVLPGARNGKDVEREATSLGGFNAINRSKPPSPTPQTVPQKSQEGIMSQFGAGQADGRGRSLTQGQGSSSSVRPGTSIAMQQEMISIEAYQRGDNLPRTGLGQLSLGMKAANEKTLVEKGGRGRVDDSSSVAESSDSYHSSLSRNNNGNENNAVNNVNEEDDPADNENEGNDPVLVKEKQVMNLSSDNGEINEDVVKWMTCFVQLRLRTRPAAAKPKKVATRVSARVASRGAAVNAPAQRGPSPDLGQSQPAAPADPEHPLEQEEDAVETFKGGRRINFGFGVISIPGNNFPHTKGVLVPFGGCDGSFTLSDLKEKVLGMVLHDQFHLRPAYRQHVGRVYKFPALVYRFIGGPDSHWIADVPLHTDHDLACVIGTTIEHKLRPFLIATWTQQDKSEVQKEDYEHEIPEDIAYNNYAISGDRN